MTKILVIEDEELIRENITELLSEEKFESIGAENGEIGLKLAQLEKPDLVLCDIMMPKMNGYRVLKLLRQNPETSHIPLIFLTAKSSMPDWRVGMNLGADDYLIKPLTAKELLRAIHARLDKQANLQKHYQDRLQKYLYFDSVTQLPNRLSLRDRVATFLNRHSNTSGLIPLCCVSIDRFSRIKETLGYRLSDRALQAVAQRLLKQTRGKATIAYLNDATFGLVFPPVANKAELQDRLETLKNNLAQPCAIGNREVYLTLSIGVAFYQRDGKDLETLLQRATNALKHAQDGGGNTIEFYSAAFSIGAAKQLDLEADLRRALDREEFEVYYQPKVNLKTGQIASSEALIRWRHPDKGMISPNQFLPLAAETGLIVPIGEWVLSEACRQTKAWHRQGYGDLRIAVNIDCRQFNQGDLRQKVVEIIVNSGLLPEYIELEITEGSLIQDPELAARRLNALKSLGIQIAIDDFGTGYSSLSYLQQFPFDILKIDQCFIRKLFEDGKSQAIVTATLEMARNLKLRTVAEGVETEAVFNFLQQQGCHEVQGYLLSPPLPADEFKKQLAMGKVASLQTAMEWEVGS